ncbi:MAG: glycyl radical enzyme family protein, partial [Nitrosotalea sp.]
VIGTFQSTLTNFRYLRPIWKRNADEERLLGVSFTGIMDHPVLSGSLQHEVGTREDAPILELWLKGLKEHAIETNKVWAERLGITQSTAITTVKPSGTVSQLVNSSSGIHPRYSRFYLRTVRNDKRDPLAAFMREKGFPVEDDVTKPAYTDVFAFPIESPSGSRFREDITAIEQLEHYLVFKRNWCEHNPSITIYVREDEWMEVGAWVYKNFGELGGVSFLPYDTGIYRQAPYQEITEDIYQTLLTQIPSEVDWTTLKEESDETTGSQELACTSGVCEI